MFKQKIKDGYQVEVPDEWLKNGYPFELRRPETPRDTIFTTEYSVRTAMEAVYGLCGVDSGVPEVWGSVYDIRELLDSTVKLMDGKSPLEMKLPMPLEALKKPILRKIDKTVVGKLLRDHGVLKDWMV